MNPDVQQATNILASGGIIIFPTDTAFGIGCRIDSEDSVDKLFDIRRRSHHKATPVLVSDIHMAEQWVDEISSQARILIQKFWPGALTCVFSTHRNDIPKLVQGGSDTLGVRMPNHSGILKIIKKVGVPIIGSSANFEGDSTPYLFNELNQELVDLVDFVLPGECKIKQPSTVLDCTSQPFRVLREGAVSSQEIKKYE